MKNSENKMWIGFAGLFVTVIGTTAVLAFKIGVVNENVIAMERTVADIPKMKTDIAEMQVKLDVLWRIHLSKSNPSIGLNDADRDALRISKIGDLVNQHYSEILSMVRVLKPDNTIQAQELLISVVNRYKKSDECWPVIQQAITTSTYDIDSLLFVAALSIRDRVVADLGFNEIN